MSISSEVSHKVKAPHIEKIRQILEDQLAPTQIIDVIAKPNGYYDDEADYVDFWVVYSSDNDLIDPEKSLPLGVRMRRELKPLKLDWWPLLHFSTEKERHWVGI